MLDVGRLAAFAAVVRTRSFSAAAESLHVTQPAVSRQVALLERQLHTSLLLRERGRIRPTPAGELLFDHAGAVLDRLRLAESQVRAVADDRRGPVRLGAFFTAMVHLSTEVAAAIAETHPELRFRDDLVDRALAFEKLARGELDLAIVFRTDLDTTPEPDDLAVEALFDDPLRVLLPRAHRLAGRTRVALADLADDTWLRAVDGRAADLVEHVLSLHHLDPARLLVGHGEEPVETQALVAAGRGITLAHELTVIVDDLAVVPLAGSAPARHISVAHSPTWRAPGVGDVLVALRRIGAQHRTRLDPRR